MALYLSTLRDTGVSSESGLIRSVKSAIVDSVERSFVLFGAKSAAIQRIYEVAAEARHDGWDGEDAVALPPFVVGRAVAFVRAFPDSLPLPEVAPEADGSLSFDWIAAQTRIFSLSIGESNRLSFAWIDGTDRGHGVARFDGATIPTRILDGIRELMDDRAASIRVA